VNRISIRRTTLALAAIATTTGIALGVNAVTEPQASALTGAPMLGALPTGAAVLFPSKPPGHQLALVKAREAAARKAAAARAADAARARAEAAARASRAAARRAVYSGDPRSIARSMLAARGWSGQWSCLDSLWTRESGWRVHASNPSGAYGIPQALPGSKMASAGSDWQNNPATQIRWGLQYIAGSYGGPCAAWQHSQSTGWY
jgi:hypothetical protein